MTALSIPYTRIEDILANAKSAKLQTGKSFRKQFSEIGALRRLAGHCGAHDYYQYGLYKDDYLDGRGREDFVGWRISNQFSMSLNPRHVVLPAWDKLVFTQLADSASLPIIETIACFHPGKNISKIFVWCFVSIENFLKIEVCIGKFFLF